MKIFKKSSFDSNSFISKNSFGGSEDNSYEKPEFFEMNDPIIRIEQELEECENSSELDTFGCSTALEDENNKFIMIATYVGPKNTPYYGGFFRLKIIFPEDYPNSPPTIYFITPIWHPNITFSTEEEGKVCISQLSDWDSSKRIIGILIAIYALLVEPNPFSALNEDAAEPLKNLNKKEYYKNNNDFYKKAKEYTIEYANNIRLNF